MLALSVGEWLLTLVAAGLLVPSAVLLAQVGAARLRQAELEAIRGRRPSLAVLMPAHNESAVIAETLRDLRPQLTTGDRLLVVADNCDDATAEIAAQEGAEVIRRQDADRRGKGYALDHGVRHLAADPPQVVIIVDADCRVEADAIARLATACAASSRPIQALYLMHAPAASGLKLRIAAFAWLVKNWVRPLGMHRLGLPCQLTGTGMAFPWTLICRADLATGHIVEDMKLGIDLALAGHPPLFCPQARVSSSFPETAAAAGRQRTRWEHGHLGLILHALPRLLGRAMVRGDLACLGLALDLAVPPLALLVLLTLLAGVLALAAGLVGFAYGPFILACIALSLLSAAVAVAWHGWGRQAIAFSALLSVPLYVLAKIPLYLRFFTRRQKEWVRTDRK